VKFIVQLALIASLSAPACVAQTAGGPGRVQANGTLFAHADGSRFHWRGITAFRLVEQVAHERESEAAAYLDWARDNGITVVRVLTMARHLFELAPADGLAALPRLLTLAAERGVHVEVVALADTAEYDVDLDAHVSAVGKIAAAHPNAFLEIANEPFHGTQDAALHDRATLDRLAALVPGEVVLAFGSPRSDDSLAIAPGGDYATVHMPRGGGDPWDHVRELAAGASLVVRYGRPVVSDEPIGAAPAAIPGRRDDSPERFRAAALLTRMTGMHATFHYEGGLQAAVPQGAELRAFEAWREAWTLLPDDIERGTFDAVDAARGTTFETRLDGEVWALTIQGSSPGEGFALVSRWPQSALWRRR
jgi:hypothetical protein